MVLLVVYYFFHLGLLKLIQKQLEVYKVPVEIGQPISIRDFREVINSLNERVDTTIRRNTELQDELNTKKTRSTELEEELNSKNEEQSIIDQIISEQDKAMKLNGSDAHQEGQDHCEAKKAAKRTSEDGDEDDIIMAAFHRTMGDHELD
jgi:predicted nuclease with TOPRIM domain